MDTTSSSSNSTRSSDGSPVDRIAEVAHAAVDKSASAVAKGERALRDAQGTAGAIASEASEHIKQYSDQSVSSVKHYISQHPAKSVGIALAGGYLLSILLKRHA